MSLTGILFAERTISTFLAYREVVGLISLSIAIIIIFIGVLKVIHRRSSRRTPFHLVPQRHFVGGTIKLQE
jgi:uncharacterized membrane protein YkgB